VLTDPGQMVVWATALQDGTPLPGVMIEGQARSGEALPLTGPALTGDDGTLRLELPGQDVALLVAKQGNDTAILPQSPYV
jgi:hypothetical protein